MESAQFKAPQAGRLVPRQGYFAFVPAPAPARLEWNDELINLLSRADAALSELSGRGAQLPNPHLLIGAYVRREAVSSSRIEGTRTTLAELLIDEVAPDAGTAQPDDAQEVRNYVVALEHGVRRLKRLPLSLRLVRELHARLMRGVRGEHGTPGEFRRSQNWIGRAGSTPATATYVPPPPDELNGCLAQWEQSLHERDKLPDLVQCALMHEQFEAIHPFLDGNGRVGRLLITLFLIERRRLSQPLLYLSDFIEEHRAEYYARLQAVRTEGDWPGWVAYFLTGVEQTARRALLQADQLLKLRETLQRRLRDTPRLASLVDELFVNPYLTVARAERALKVSNPTARQAVRKLHDLGIVEELTGRDWGKVFVARSVLQAIESSGKPRRKRRPA
jgi:Fic family protein